MPIGNWQRARGISSLETKSLSPIALPQRWQKKTKGRLATGDPEFKQVEKEIEIMWLL
jgi:hypothetical protein